ncbi:MAG: twin-arginine translocase subunit TatC [Pseudomonadota bacterium]
MSAADEIEDSSAPLMEHLIELRQRLIYSVSAFLVAMVICFSFGGMLLDFLLGPIEKTMRDLGDGDDGDGSFPQTSHSMVTTRRECR